MSNENGQVRERRVIKISKKKLILSVVIIVVLAFVLYLFRSMNNIYSTSMESPIGNFPVSGMSVDSYKSSESMPYPDYYNRGNGDITDTREFMKTSYSSTIKTRDVSSTVNSVKNIVKGADGRVDNIQSGDKYGYVSFVVPKTNFDSFRDEVEALTKKKLYIENISSQNLLSTKQNIEERTTDVETSLSSLNSQKTTLNNQHTQTLSTLNAELNRIQAQLAVIKTSIANITSSTPAATITSLNAQEESLLSQEIAIRDKISNENSEYNRKKISLESQITNLNSSLTGLKKEDTKFANNIETVTGSVSVNWVSVWQLIGIYSPIHPFWEIIILIAIVWAYLRHKKITPKIVIE